MSLGLRADPTNTSAVLSVAGVDQVVITNAGNVTANTFTGALNGNASTATKFAATVGVAPVYGCRAWVNFDAARDNNGVASVANTPRFIYGSGNVSSVDRMASGDYIVNFQIAMPDTLYAVNYSNNGFVVTGGGSHAVPFVTCPSVRSLFTTSQVAVSTFSLTNSLVRADPSFNSVVVFR